MKPSAVICRRLFTGMDCRSTGIQLQAGIRLAVPGLGSVSNEGQTRWVFKSLLFITRKHRLDQVLVFSDTGNNHTRDVQGNQ